MKKNVMMRVASIMLVLVLMSSSVISGTFAKYVTSGESEDNARVARFGVTVSADFEKTFTRGYKLADVKSADTEAESSVWAVSETDVVAPGTAGSLANFAVIGKPEVDVRVNYEATLNLHNWKLDMNKDNTLAVEEPEYCPIVITITYNSVTKTYGMDAAHGTGDACTVTYPTVAEFEAGVAAAIAACTADYQANQDLSQVNDDLTISWAWPFEKGDANDVKDTMLGDQAAYSNDIAGKIAVEVKCTVTQIN